MHRDERALIDGCLAGDRAAWDAFVERYGRLVYSVPRKLGLSETDADDIFQTVFAIVLRRLETLRDTERVTAWLIRVAYRESWRVAAQRKARGAPLPLEHAASDTPADEFVQTLEQQQLVRSAISQIDARCRGLLEALFFEHPTPEYREIAARLGMSIGSIGPTRARCFQKLESLLRAAGL